MVICSWPEEEEEQIVVSHLSTSNQGAFNMEKIMERVKALEETTEEMKKEQKNDVKRIEELEDTIKKMQEKETEYKNIITTLKEEITNLFKENETLKARLKRYEEKPQSDSEVMGGLCRLTGEEYGGENEFLNTRLRDKGISKTDWLEVAKHIITVGGSGAAVAAFLIKCATAKVSVVATATAALATAEFEFK